MWSHIKAKHKAELQAMPPDDPENIQLNEDSSSLPSTLPAKNMLKNYLLNPKNVLYSKNSEKRSQIDRKIGLMIAIDYQPLSIVENKGFKDLIKELDPRYEMISRKMLTMKILPEMFEEAASILCNKLQTCKSGIALTADCWTSTSNESYLGITCHFFEPSSEELLLQSAILDTVPIPVDEKSESLSSIITAVMKEWGIAEKVSTLVTDSTANMIRTATFPGLPHIPCYAHALNTVVKTSVNKSPVANISEELGYFNKIRETITVCKNIVSFFQSSAKATRLLNKLKKDNMEETEYLATALVQQVDVRFNTLLYMLESVMINHEYIKRLDNDQEYEKLVLLKKSERTLVDDSILILKPFEEITVKLSGEKYLTISEIIPLTTGLLHSLSNLYHGTGSLIKTNEGKYFAQRLFETTKVKLLPYEEIDVCRLSTILDPRFKKKAFYLEINALAAESLLRSRISNRVMTLESPCSQKQKSIEPSASNEGYEDWEKEVEVIITSYLREPIISLNDDVFKYWCKNQNCILFEQMKINFVTPASSVPVERLFSRSGYIVSDRRNRLSKRNVQLLSFLNSNYKFLF